VRVIAWIDVDLFANGRGLTPRCLHDLAGLPVLARVVEGALACPSVREVAVTCPPRDRETVHAALAGLTCRVLGVEAPDVVNRALRRRARKWAGHSWRGGISSTYLYDEEGNPGAMYAALVALEASHALKLSPSGPFVDTAMVEAMIAQVQTLPPNQDFCVSSAPPGLNYEVYGRTTAAKFAQGRDTIRTSLALKPGELMPDPTSFDFWHALDVDVVACSARLLVDSARGEALVRGLVEAEGLGLLRAPAAEVVRALARRPGPSWWRLPEEVEVEVCSETAVAFDLRPVVRRDVPRMDLATMEALADGLAGADDVRWSFGGLGDPLLHTGLEDLIGAAKRKGAYGVHVATSGAAVTREAAAMLARSDVDVVTVELTAATPEGYARLHGDASFAKAVAGVEALLAEKRDGAPLVLVEWVKVKELEGEFEAFHDHWAPKADGVVIRGACGYAGQVADRAVMHLLPGTRSVCERLQRRMSILPNGDVTLCEMDYLGRHAVGNVLRDRVEDLWRGRFEEVRLAHARGEFGAHPLCSSCQEWGAL